MMMRQASVGDTARVREIAHAAYARYVGRIGREPAPMTANFEAHIRRGELAVVEMAGAVLGYVVAYSRAGDFFVENVAVDPAYAGKGLGKFMMTHAEMQARAGKRGVIRLYTNVAMTENFPFYAALGYRKTHEATEAGFQRAYFEKLLEQK